METKPKAWLPNGSLKGGIMLGGPTINKPDDDRFLEVDINGKPYFVRYCCNQLTDEQKEEVKKWAEEKVSKLTH